MPNSLQSEPVRDLLGRLFLAADDDDLRLLEPRLTPGALVLADDTIFLAAEMTDYVRDPANGYVSVEFPDADGIEITCRA